MNLTAAICPTIVYVFGKVSRDQRDGCLSAAVIRSAVFWRRSFVRRSFGGGHSFGSHVACDEVSDIRSYRSKFKFK